MVYQFQHGHSFFHRLDPVSKFIWLLCVSIVCLRFDYTLLQSAIAAAVALIGRAGAGMRWRTMAHGLKWPFLFAVPYFVLQLLFLPGETELTRIGPIAVTTEALDFAAAITLRMLTLILSSLLFIVTTDPRDVVLAMAQTLRIPYRFAFAVAIALRFMPILQAEAEHIRTAHRLRGGLPVVQDRNATSHGQNADARTDGRLHEKKRLSWREKLAWRKRFIAAVFIGAARRVQLTADVMELRGFGSQRKRTYVRSLTIRPSGIALAVISGAVAVLMLVWL